MPDTPNTDESIFAAAAPMPLDQRAAYLDEVCGTDAALRDRIESLLRSHDECGSFLDRQPLPALTTDFVPLTESAGSVIGRYKLLQAIGEGGFGVVYMAEQKEPIRRKVALKVIKLGMDSREVVARFEAERQALALMDHPNIAKVLDAGATDTGRPYFVMELVKGVPIVEFCDKNQLPARERLQIFTAVCQAVQHAHQKGIIHRDLKPSNVLVTLHDGKPVPKVIDFGVAKALNQELTEKTLFTAFGHMVGTPQYMSPEQAEMSGLDVDTRSDVYSLGVLLYELLTGTTPLEGRRLRSAGYAEMQRLIREEEAPRPSLRLSTLGERLSVIARDRQCDPKGLQSLLRGELDWIVMKALEKDRGRRYDTATGMAKDIERYLADEPVEACPPSAGYLLRKLARKHRKALAFALAFALLLVAAAVVSSWQAVRATLAEGEATQKSKALDEAEVQVRAERDDARDARDELRGSLYVARANLIQLAWGADNIGRVRQLLDQQRPRPGNADLRGFEWHYFQRLAHADLRTLDLSDELSSGVLATVLSPDGSRLAAVTAIDKEGKASRVRVWELATRREVLSAPTAFGIAQLAFSRDGKRLGLTVMPTALPGFGQSGLRREVGRLVVWDCDSGKELFTAGGDPVGVALSLDGRRAAAVFQQDPSSLLRPFAGPLAVGPGRNISFVQNVKVWDVDTHKELGILRDVAPQVTDLTFSPDGDRLAATLFSPNTRDLPSQLRMWEIAGNKRWSVVTSHQTAGVQFSPDGSRLACSSAQNMTNADGYESKLFDAASGKELLTIFSSVPVRGSTFSPSGKLLARGTGPNVQVWDAATGKESRTLRGHTGVVTGVAFNADGSRLVSVDSAGVVKEWATPGVGVHEEVASLGQFASPDGAFRLSYMPPGGFRGFGRGGPAPGDKVIKVFDRAGKPLYSFEKHAVGVQSVQFSPDGRYVVSKDSDGKTLVWEAVTGKTRLSLDGVNGLHFSASGNRVAGGWSRGGVKVWDTSDFQERLSLGGRTWSPFLSPDGSRLLFWSAAEDPNQPQAPEWKLWDVDAARQIAAIPFEKPDGPQFYEQLSTFDAAGKHVAVIDGTNIRVWDAVNGSQVAVLQCPDAPKQVVLNAAGTLLAAIPGGFRPSSPGMRMDFREAPEGIPIWDIVAGKVRFRLKGHTARVWAVAFSPDGKRVASLAAGLGSGRQGEVKLWDAATGAELLELKPDAVAPATILDFSADGTRLNTELSNNRRWQTWDATPLPEE